MQMYHKKGWRGRCQPNDQLGVWRWSKPGPSASYSRVWGDADVSPGSQDQVQVYYNKILAEMSGKGGRTDGYKARGDCRTLTFCFPERPKGGTCHICPPPPWLRPWPCVCEWLVTRLTTIFPTSHTTTREQYLHIAISMIVIWHDIYILIMILHPIERPSISSGC